VIRWDFDFRIILKLNPTSSCSGAVFGFGFWVGVEGDVGSGESGSTNACAVGDDLRAWCLDWRRAGELCGAALFPIRSER
jgi:hypothetical protein